MGCTSLSLVKRRLMSWSILRVASENIEESFDRESRVCEDVALCA